MMAPFSLLLAASVLASAAAPSSTPPLVAMTVDDLPLASGSDVPLSGKDARQAGRVNARILAAFRRHHIPAIGFVNQQHVDRIGTRWGEAILAGWTEPGFDLGNHLYSHADVNELSIDQAEQEILRGRRSIDKLLARAGRRPAFLRFPYNHSGDTKEKHDALAAFIAAQGLRLAPCTIDNDDFEFNQAYAIARARRDAAMQARIRDAYVAFTAATIDWYSKLDAEVLGYPPPHIMLLHDSPLNADTIERIIALFDQRGFAYVSLAEAERDKAYSIPEIVTKYGPMWGYRWARALHVKVDTSGEPNPPVWLGAYLKSAARS